MASPVRIVHRGHLSTPGLNINTPHSSGGEMGTIVSVKKDFDIEEGDWDLGETMAHSGYLHPLALEDHRKQATLHSFYDDGRIQTAKSKIINPTNEQAVRSGRLGRSAAGRGERAQSVKTVNVTPAYAPDQEDIDAAVEEMDTLELQSSVTMQWESIAPSPEPCALQNSAVALKVTPTKDGGAPSKKHKPPRLINTALSLSPVPPVASRKRTISGERVSGAERQRLQLTEKSIVKSSTTEQNAARINTLDADLSHPSGRKARIASPNPGGNPAREKAMSASREYATTPLLKNNRKLPPIERMVLRPSLMSIGSSDLAIVLPPRSPQTPQPLLPGPQQKTVNVVITKAIDEQEIDATPPQLSTSVPTESYGCSTELDAPINTDPLPADSSNITKLLFDEISDSGSTMTMEDSPTKDSGIDEGEEEEVRIRDGKVALPGGHEVKASLSSPPAKDTRSGSLFVPPDDKFIRKAAKLRGEGIGKLKNLTPTVRQNYDDFMVDIENVSFYAKQQAEATMGDYTPQKVLLISSRVPNCDSLKAAVRPDVLCQIYDFENETLKGIVEIVKNLLNGYKEGAKAKYLGIVCKGGPGYMYLLTKTPVTPAKLKQNGDMIMFWKCIGILMSKLVPRGSVIHLMESNVAGNVQGEKLLQDMESILSSSQVCVQAPLEMSPRGGEMIGLYFDPEKHRQWKSTRYPKLQLYTK